MNRKNIIAFVDEGHRTQYGMLAAQMKKLLKNAFFFAFTGTPISKKGRNTYQEFSNPPQEPYLDRYFVVDSIKDEFTVKIAYQPRLERDVHLKKEMLETFLEVELDEIPDFAREEVEEKTKKKLNPINAYLENETRISRIAADIAADFKSNVAGKFKAMIVAASRNACLTYRREMLKYFPEGTCEVVMTKERKRENIATFVRETRERYEGDDYERIQKKIIENFKESENPQILIVTDMLLTGFDAPILQRMYLDKPLKEHRLLQAVARTNRPYKGIKEAGLIIDYVGILKEFKRAFEIYSKDDIALYINDVGDLRNDFMGLMADTVKVFGALNGKYTRDVLLKATEVITADPVDEKEFVENYRSLRKLFELLGPDEIKLDYFQTFKWLSAVYTYYMKTVMKGSTADALVEKYLDKTIKYVYKTTEIEELNSGLPVITFDADYLKNLEEKVKSREEKAANIMFDLQRYILVEKNQSPVYETLAERVERLIELWREKTKDYDRIYQEGSSIWNDAMAMQARQKRLGLKNMEYALLLVIEQSLGEGDKHLDEIRELSEEIDRIAYPGWGIQATAIKSAERIVRQFCRRLKASYNMPIEKMDDLYNKMIGQVKNYGA
jgi:type I restriction enzyme R subunit